MRVMTDGTQDADSLLGDLSQPLHSDQLAALLALRGMLAHGLLAHALQKRHGVDYGVDRYASQSYLCVCVCVRVHVCVCVCGSCCIPCV